MKQCCPVNKVYNLLIACVGLQAAVTGGGILRATYSQRSSSQECHQKPPHCAKQSVLLFLFPILLKYFLFIYLLQYICHMETFW